MTNNKLLHITKNGANFFSARFANRFIKSFSIVCLLVTLLCFEALLQDISLKNRIGLIFIISICFLLVYLLHRNFDREMHPLKIFETGIEMTDSIVSWKLPEMKRSKQFPVLFIPFSQIERIDFSFSLKGSIKVVAIVVKKEWEGYNEIHMIEMQPSLAKEMIGYLKQVLGTQQIQLWINKTENRYLRLYLESSKSERLLLESSKTHGIVVSSLKETFGEDISSSLLPEQE